MRQLTGCLAVLATAGLLAACGTSSHRAAAPGAHTATATGAHAVDGPQSRRQAIAFARAVNLRASDLPGFSVSVERGNERKTATEKQAERELSRCLGAFASSSDELAEVSSKHFKYTRGLLDVGVSSTVSVTRPPGLTAAEVAALHGGRVRACLSRYLDLLVRGTQFHGAQVSPFSIVSGTPPAPGTAGGYGWRIKATIAIRRIKIPIYVDILGFVDGPANVALMSTGLLAPVPAVIQQRLFLRLLGRAKAHHA
jgi:hypothetical protein